MESLVATGAERYGVRDDAAGDSNVASLLGLPEDAVPGMQVEKGQWHMLGALESGTVILEMKDGAYEPIGAEDVMER